MKLLNTHASAARSLAFPLFYLRRSRLQKGFTLTEVVLALGIIAFAFIPVLGLLPLGLDTSRQAIDTTVEAQIVQSLSSKALQADFSNLDTLTNSFYFDYQGNSTSEPNAVYKVGFDVSPTTELPNSGATSKLATVTICILNTKTRYFSKEPDPLKNTASKKYSLLIADNGR
jgi:uncharacterized protein (TIGR02598 family)